MNKSYFYLAALTTSELSSFYDGGEAEYSAAYICDKFKEQYPDKRLVIAITKTPKEALDATQSGQITVNITFRTCRHLLSAHYWGNNKLIDMPQEPVFEFIEEKRN